MYSQTGTGMHGAGSCGTSVPNSCAPQNFSCSVNSSNQPPSHLKHSADGPLPSEGLLAPPALQALCLIRVVAAPGCCYDCCLYM